MGSAMVHVSLRVAIKIEQETGFSYSVLLNKSKPASTNPSNHFLFHSVHFVLSFIPSCISHDTYRLKLAICDEGFLIS